MTLKANTHESICSILFRDNLDKESTTPERTKKIFFGNIKKEKLFSFALNWIQERPTRARGLEMLSYLRPVNRN